MVKIADHLNIYCPYCKTELFYDKEDRIYQWNDNYTEANVFIECCVCKELIWLRKINEFSNKD